MKLFLKVTLLSFLVFANCSIPAPEPSSEPEESLVTAVARDYTEEEKKFIEKVHKDIPGLHPDTFKLVDTPFRKKLTDAEKAARKKEREEKKAREEEMIETQIRESIEEHSKKLGKLSKKELDDLHKKLSKDLKEVDQKMRRGEL